LYHNLRNRLHLQLAFVATASDVLHQAFERAQRLPIRTQQVA
jgi:hypothetical protein